MKLFYKKDYEKLKENHMKYIRMATATIDLLNENIREQNNKIILQEEKIEELKLLRRKFNSAKGGFNTKINKLTKENEELKRKLEESMSDKYLVKKLPSRRTPNTLKTHLKSNAKTSSIVKKIYE